MKQHHPSFLRRFAADTRGSILMIVGLVFLLLVGIAGAGYDLGMRELLRAHTQRAADFAASSAGGIEDPINGMTDAQRETTAQRYFSLNFGDSFLGEPKPTPVVNIPGDGTISVTAASDIDTKFVRNFGSGHETLDAGGHSKVGISKPPERVFLLVVDTSGSMTNSAAYPMPAPYYNRLGVAKVAAKGLTNILLTPANSTLPTNQQNKVGLITWGMAAGTMLAPTSNKALIDAAIDNMPPGGGTNSYSGLNAAYQMALANPNAVKGILLLTDGGNNIGPMINGIPGTMWPYQDQTASDPNVTTWLIANNYAAGGTANITGSTYPNYPNFVINSQSLGVCDLLKTQQQAVIYSVGFGAGPFSPQDTLQQNSETAVQNFLSSCATGGSPVPYGPFTTSSVNSYPPANPTLIISAIPNTASTNLGSYYFLSLTPQDLIGAFANIAANFNKVRIIE
jgi:hypothetical protein